MHRELGDRDREALEVAIIGSGFMGRVHSDAARLAGGRIRSVGVRSAERAQHAKAALGVDRVYLGPEEVADDSEVDVVHVCTPNASHAPYVRAALQAGKHVVCEKPLGLSLDEAQGLAELAARTPVVTTMPFVYRYYPTVREAAVRVRSGDLGSVRLVHGSYLQDWLSDLTAWNWRVSAQAGGPSRAFADIGVHWCDLAEFITGHRIMRLCTRLSFSDQRRSPGGAAAQTEDAVVMAFETDRGGSGTLIVSQVSHGQKNRIWIEVDGTQGSVVFDHEQPDLLTVSAGDETKLLHQGTASMSAEAAAFSRVPAGHPQGYTDCFALFVRDTYRAIRAESPPGLPTFADGLRAAEIVNAVLAAATSESWTDVSPRV